MALVKCPKCGREGIPDSVEICPDCGYDIPKHFQKTQEEIERSNQERQQKPVEEEQLRLQEEAKLRKEEAHFEAMEKKAEITKIISSIVGTIALLIMIYTFSIGGEKAHAGLGWVIFIAFWAVLFSIVCFVSAMNDSDIASTALSKIRTGGMEQLRSWQHDQAVALHKQLEAQQAKDRLNHPTCPMCGSNNTIKISTLNRSVSIALTGLASSKIGKQYECKKCHHKW